MSDLNTARIRTALPQAWGAVVVFIITRLHIVPDDSTTDLLVFAAFPAVGAVVYDLGRRLEAAGWARTARLLLGSAKTPTYEPTAPQESPPPLG